MIFLYELGKFFDSKLTFGVELGTKFMLNLFKNNM